MQLKPGTFLQGGKYKIEGVLGQGGFGITYLGLQTGLNRKVAIKEFFMKEYCDRSVETSRVTVNSQGSRDAVDRFRKKFIKEAQTIAQMDHPSVVRIYDIFEENATAYFVMEYIPGGSLEDLVKRVGALNEKQALDYICQVAEALGYIHKDKILHLDVKPSNILLRDNNRAVLIDFGISKRYDASGDQTSTTPAGVSKGYAPIEQYRQGGVDSFLPCTDIYSLGATFYKLLTGNTPPEASDIYEEGLPALPDFIRSTTSNAIKKAMQPGKKQRPQSVKEFLSLLNKEEKREEKEDTEIIDVIPVIPIPEAIPTPEPVIVPSERKKSLKIYGGIVVLLIAIVFIFILKDANDSATAEDAAIEETETASIEPAVVSPNDKQLTVNGVSFDMVYVEGGEFSMGSKDAAPVHSVTLSSYYIGKTEVTQALWKAVMGNNPSCFQGDDLPVENVSWDDCQAFIKKLNSLSDKTFRLPTEAEWEYAARGGNKKESFLYSGSDNLEQVAWYGGNSGSKTHPVGKLAPNGLGLYDMTGNVWEWCSDWYGSYPSSKQTNPSGPATGSYRVYRGGSWSHSAGSCAVSCRGNFTPDFALSYLGFRLVFASSSK